MILFRRGKSKNGVSNGSIMYDDKGPPPRPPEPPPQKLTKEQLLPPTPSIYLENKKQAFSPQLQEFCLKHPIAVVRGIAAALKLGNFFFSLLLHQFIHPANFAIYEIFVIHVLTVLFVLLKCVFLIHRLGTVLDENVGRSESRPPDRSADAGATKWRRKLGPAARS